MVEHVLLKQSTSCVTTAPTFVLQTEEDAPARSLTSHTGYCVGNITITTDGANIFTVSADGGVHQGPNELAASGLPRGFTLDDGAPLPDTTAPTTSITSPSNGATVSATVSVTASASDNVGVTKVEFYLDGALQSTDTTSPYSWSWNTTTATNASHALVAKAYDAANNIGTSSTVNVTVNNGVPINIGGYTITQANATLTYTIPAGTIIPSHGYVIIGRNATQAQFQSFWGVTLGSNVVYLNSADTMPQINGSETYDLRNASSTRIDGITVAMGTSAGESLKRTNACAAANLSTSWTRTASSTGNPGTGAPAPCGKGAFISEFSDALGTGNYIYEFVEIANDL